MKKTDFTSMFADNLRNDAGEVYRQMQLPTVLRLRAEVNASEDHPLLSLRMHLMETHREQMKNLARSLLEGDPPLDTEMAVTRLGRDLQAAYRSCVRVLEIADDPEVKNHVAVCAKAMGGSMQLMASILGNQRHQISHDVQLESIRAIDLSERIEEVSYRLKISYQQMREEFSRLGERIAPEAPVSQMAHN